MNVGTQVPQPSSLLDHAYVLAASRGRGARAHIVAGGALGQNGTFKTLCGRWGSSKEMPWHVGQMRCDAPGWCKRCLRSEASEAGRA